MTLNVTFLISGSSDARAMIFFCVAGFIKNSVTYFMDGPIFSSADKAQSGVLVHFFHNYRKRYKTIIYRVEAPCYSLMGWVLDHCPIPAPDGPVKQYPNSRSLSCCYYIIRAMQLEFAHIMYLIIPFISDSSSDQ